MYIWSSSKKDGGWETNMSKEIMTEYIPNLVETVNPHIQEVQWTTGRINTVETTPRLIIIKLLKTRNAEQILKVARGKKKSHFSEKQDKSNESSCPQMVQIRRQWRNIFKVLKINNNRTEILCPVKIFLNYSLFA